MLKDLSKLRTLCWEAYLSNQSAVRWALLELLIPPYNYKLLPAYFGASIKPTICTFVVSFSFPFHHHTLMLSHDAPF